MKPAHFLSDLHLAAARPAAAAAFLAWARGPARDASAVYLLGGVKPLDGSDGVQRFADFLSQAYHLPGDDLARPVSWVAAARLARVNYAIGVAVGDADSRPAWQPGDFFGTRFGGR